MSTVTISKDIAAPAEAVWKLLADFADVSWIPVAGDVQIDGEGAGMSRTIGGSGGDPTVETLRWIDREAKRLAYEITNNPLPVSRFEAVVSVADSSAVEAGCRVEWDVYYVAAADVASARESIQLVYGMMAGWLEDAAKPGAAVP
jgi:hypothetical protein